MDFSMDPFSRRKIAIGECESLFSTKGVQFTDIVSPEIHSRIN